MRVSVPGIPQAILAAAGSSPAPSLPAAIERISTFLAPGNATVITGAGVSVDSGIRAYRGKDGRYTNPNYKPIFYHELIDETPRGYAFRQRYWLRSYLGYPPVRDALPNTTHYALAALQYAGLVPRLITQNVDGLHHKALRGVWDEARLRERILELHGTLHKVHCNHGHTVDRETFQDWLSAANPQWKAYADDLERTGRQPRTNPDGDVVLEGVEYETFVVPHCPSCMLEGRRNSVLKPEVIFFGESIRQQVRERSFEDVEKGDRLFVVGTTLATYSAFRLLKHALQLKKPVLMLNVGPTRADSIAELDKIDLPTSAVLREVVKALVGVRAVEDPVIREMLASGITRPPLDDDGEDVTGPGAAG
ncbi:DHS-like NAD/FAD-binding domain-containing protein [Gloeophyllum trabeum ATCC 11539]|uniref:DHS-like NAD/FAD-binding domain-containing protein n=1 Tax=Gloeophyllum trabeum (strain ATCC 11539 / FP-39264 / Madison 617) TaxID=670483 RepID=S7Q9Q3_GLOTA|nr:DHS-like NAD/FAD-binding domain-containing protein [Gloeophyllum trabeum ATCC 11539]EPQ56252.1 DHS-like NAD/FAD-binding domain-containing protein [Gloeophyllum trabeum ATCC 11539]